MYWKYEKGWIKPKLFSLLKEKHKCARKYKFVRAILQHNGSCSNWFNQWLIYRIELGSFQNWPISSRFFFWHVRSRQQLQTSSLSMDFWTVIFILVFCDLFLIATKLRNRFLVDVIIVSAGNFKWHFKKRMFWNLDREYSWFDFPSIWEKKHTFKYHQCQYRHRLPPR